MGRNELIFLLHAVAAFSILVVAARLGRAWLTSLIVTFSILMNITVNKQLTLFGLPVTAGNVLYAAVFLANDALNEHYGRKAALSAVYHGFAASVAVVVVMSFELGYAPNELDQAQPHLEALFGVTAYARVVTASMISYLLSQWLDSYLYQRIRFRTGTDRLLWLRSNGSTFVSQAFDTVFFTTAGLAGTVITTWRAWAGAVVFAYVVKVVAAIVDTPFLYLTTWRPLMPQDSQRATIAAAAAR